MPLEGVQLGHYRLLRLIGSGGMSEVYLAEDTRITRQVAIKVIRADITSSPTTDAQQEVARLFRREMQAITVLDHHHILPLYDFGEEHLQNTTFTYMVMPFRPDGSLAQWLHRRGDGPLSPADVANLIQQAAEALQHAHDHHIIHQDVKPSNFLIRIQTSSQPNQPDLFLSDFGIARSGSTVTTGTQQIRGTPSYMAPEQWLGQPTPASDQYALAIMAYHLLTGRPPFTGSIEQVWRQHLRAQPQPPGIFNPRVPPALDAVILRALSKQSEERFASISDFAAAFQQALQSKHELTSPLAISQEEAWRGTTRQLTLPSGRQVTVSVPPGTREGQVIRLPDQGESLYNRGPRGSLVVKIIIAPSAPPPPPVPAGSSNEKTVLSSAGSLPPPPIIENRQSSGAHDLNNLSLPDHTRSRRRPLLIALLAVTLVGLIAIALSGTIIYQNNLNAGNAAATAHAQGTALAVRATATATASVNPYPPHQGILVVSDPLNQPFTSMWANSTNASFGGTCQFTNGAYHVSQSKTVRLFDCDERFGTHSNFTFEAQMTILKGDCGGLIFRESADGNQFYYFRICQDRSYRFDSYANSSGKQTTILADNHYSGIKAGLGQTNLIAVTANKNKVDLYVNNQYLQSVTDNHFSQGYLGLVAEATTTATEVAFKNVRIWRL